MDIIITNITFFYLERRWERMNWSWQNLRRLESNEKFHLAIFGSPANTSFPGFVCFSSSSLIRRFPPRLGKWPSLVCVNTKHNNQLLTLIVHITMMIGLDSDRKGFKILIMTSKEKGSERKIFKILVWMIVIVMMVVMINLNGEVRYWYITKI